MKVVDLHPSPSDFLQDVRDGLRASPKTLPCKYFYDRKGSDLFDQICELPEYYPTRTEISILREHLPKMAERIGPRAMVVEYGSGSGIKTELLLDHLDSPVAYVPIEISRGHLEASARELAARHPGLEVLPVCGDFTERLQLPEPSRAAARRVLFFPGSTIGNFTPDEARELLRRTAALLGEDGGLLLGIDLEKDPSVLEAAYDDSAGVTAAFNLNLLHRIREELGASLDPSQFAHRAVYNAEKGRIEMHLVSRGAQSIQLGDETFAFEPGEVIHTESSHKYTCDGFAALAASAGWQLKQSWTDERQWFAVQFYRVAND